MSERSGGSERRTSRKGEKDGKLSLLRGGKEVKVRGGLRLLGASEISCCRSSLRPSLSFPLPSPLCVSRSTSNTARREREGAPIICRLPRNELRNQEEQEEEGRIGARAPPLSTTSQAVTRLSVRVRVECIFYVHVCTYAR